MSQFTNAYNGQNGMGSNSQSMPIGPGQNYPGNWGPPTNGQNQPPIQIMDPMQSAQQQGWKPYAPQPQPRVMPVFGRWVDSFDEIKPQEVQMDGNLYLFPQSDRQCIYARFWDNNGNLQTYRFFPEKIEPPQQSIQSHPSELSDQMDKVGNSIFARIDELEKNLNELVQSLNHPPKASPKAAKNAVKEEVVTCVPSV